MALPRPLPDLQHSVVCQCPYTALSGRVSGGVAPDRGDCQQGQGTWDMEATHRVRRRTRGGDALLVKLMKETTRKRLMENAKGCNEE